MKYLRNSKILLIITLLMNLSLYVPIEVLYLSNMGISIAVISMLNLVVPLSCAIFEIPTGILGDYLGRKKTLILSIGMFAISSLLLIFSKSTIMFFLVYIFEGIGWSFFSGNTDAIIIEESKRKNVDIGSQFAFFYTGFTIAPIISGISNSVRQFKINN